MLKEKLKQTASFLSNLEKRGVEGLWDIQRHRAIKPSRY